MHKYKLGMPQPSRFSLRLTLIHGEGTAKRHTAAGQSDEVSLDPTLLFLPLWEPEKSLLILQF